VEWNGRKRSTEMVQGETADITTSHALLQFSPSCLSTTLPTPYTLNHQVDRTRLLTMNDKKRGRKLNDELPPSVSPNRFYRFVPHTS